MSQYRTYGIIILVCLLAVIYTMTSSGKFHIVDEVSLFSVTESLALRGEMDTNAIAWTQWVNSPGEVLGAFGPEGDVFSKKGPAPAFAALPWYMLMRALALLNLGIGLVQSTLLWNGLVTALTAGLLWLTLIRLDFDDFTGALLATLFGLTTIAWPYANHFFGEPLSALSLLTTFYGLLAWQRSGKIRWALIAGIGGGIAIFTVTAHVLLVGILGLYLLAGWLAGRNIAPSAPSAPSASSAPAFYAERNGKDMLRALIAFVVPITIGALLLLWYNNQRFGDPFETGYHFDSGEGFTTPILQGLWGLLGSPYRGLFWHTPLFIVSLIAFVPFLRRRRIEGALIAGLSVVLVGLYATWWMWWGGFAWGPRFLVPLTPFWVLLIAPFSAHLFTSIQARTPKGWRTIPRSIPWTGWLLIVLAPISFVVQILATTLNYVNYEIQLRALFPTDWEDPLAFGPPAQEIKELIYSPVVGQLRLWRDGFTVNTDLAWLWPDGNIQWLVLLVGLLALATLLLAFGHWWVIGIRQRQERDLPSRPARWALILIPAIVILTWSGEVSRNAHYGDPGRGYRAALAEVCTETRGEDVLISIAPFAYQVPMNWMGSLCRTEVPIYGYAKNSLEQPEARLALERLINEYDRIWIVTGGLPANDPQNSIERRLADITYKADDRWYEDYRLVRYATKNHLDPEPLKTLSIPLIDKAGQVVTVLAARAPKSIPAGHIVPIDIRYEVVTPLKSDLRWFVQLLAPDGHPIALLDTEPDDGYTRFTQLPVNLALIERAGLQLPHSAQPGTYQLIAGLYDPGSEDNARMKTPTGVDFIELGKVNVE
jgi:hypothetical protein